MSQMTELKETLLPQHKRTTSDGLNEIDEKDDGYVYAPIEKGRYKHKVVKFKKILLKQMSDDKNNSLSKNEDSKDKEEEIEYSDEVFYYAYNDPKKAKRIIFLDGKIKRIGNIDTSLESFDVAFHFYFTWLASKEDIIGYNKFIESSDGKKEWVPNWLPEFSVANKIGGEENLSSDYGIKAGSDYKTKVKTKGTCNDDYQRNSWDIDKADLGFDPTKGYWIRCQYDCNMTLAERLELESFPFDHQDFTIHLQLKKKQDLVDLLPFPRVGPYFIIDPTWSLLNEWNLEKLLSEFIYSDPSYAKTQTRKGKAYSLACIHIKTSRKWMSKVSDFIITLCMFGLGLAIFSIPKANIGERLGYGVTLLLSDVATLQLLEGQLPNISYWTILDYYMYLCFFYLCSIIGWSCLDTLIDTNNKIDVILFIVINVIIQIIFAYWAYSAYHEEKRKLNMNNAELETYFESRKKLFCSRVTSKDEKMKNRLKSNWNYKKMFKEKV